MTPVAPTADREPALLRAIVLVQLVWVAAFGVGVSLVGLREHFEVLFVDDWRILDHYQTKPLASYLFGAENGHRAPVTLALFAADHEWLGGRMRGLVWASVVCLSLCVALLAWIFRRHDGLLGADSRARFGFACFALFWAASCNELHKGLYQMNLQTVALVLLAIGAVALADPDRPRESRRSLGVALLASLGATLSQGAGAASWAALVAVAAVRRLRWRVVAALAATGAAVLALFAATLPPDPKVSFRESLAFAAEHPRALGSFSLAFVGSAPARVLVGLGIGVPVPRTPERRAWEAHTRSLQRISIALGAAGVLLFAAVALRLRARRPPPPILGSVGTGLMAFGVGNALLVTFVRASVVGPGALVQPRFTIWSTLFWVGAVLALAPRPDERIAGARAWIAAIALPVVCVAMLPALGDVREFHATTRSQASRLELSLLLGLRDDVLADGVSLEGADLVYRVASRLEREGRWPFQGPRHRLRGQPLAERFALGEGCTGALHRVREVDAPGAAAVSGWMLRASAPKTPAFFVLADESGIVRGLADSLSAPPRFARSVGPERIGWTGFVADYDPEEAYTAWAISADGTRACRLQAR